MSDKNKKPNTASQAFGAVAGRPQFEFVGLTPDGLKAIMISNNSLSNEKATSLRKAFAGTGANKSHVLSREGVHLWDKDQLAENLAKVERNPRKRALEEQINKAITAVSKNTPKTEAEKQLAHQLRHS